MYGVAARGGSFASSLKASKTIGAIVTRNSFPVVKDEVAITVEPKPLRLSESVVKGITLGTRQSSTIGTQVRYVHTDHMQVPDFSNFKKASSSSPYKDEPEEDTKSVVRKNFTYILGAGVLMPAAVVAKTIVHEVLSTLEMTGDVLALSKTEVDLNKIPEGKTIMLTWRSKPLFVRHRTQAEIEAEQNVKLENLRDPQHDNDRCKRPEWLLVLGVCTHLGCVPISDAGTFGGFFCPCHGSHYDISGRIRKGPAPENLEVPPYDFPSDDLCIVG